MNRIKNQVVAGIDYIPVVDANYQPITIGCTLKATVAVSKPVLHFEAVTIEVERAWLPECVLRGEGWCIPFYYDPERRLMVGKSNRPEFPVLCLVESPSAAHQSILARFVA